MPPPRVRLPSIGPPRVRRPYSTHLPPLPPPSGTTKLTPTRRLIELHGIDAPKFLQGVTTTNIPSLTDGRGGAYCAFLTAQGRVLYDVFIYPTSRSPTWRATTTGGAGAGDPSYFIECDAACTASLTAHIRRYKLRSRFTIRAIPPGEWDVWALWDDTAHAVNIADHEIDCVDARAPRFGRRAVLHGGRPPALEAEVPRVDAAGYKLRRILHGVPEGQTEIVGGAALPAESCVDYMGGVDFRKGCYLGQELTIRTQHRGVVRKRILPVQVYRLGDRAPGELRYDPGEAAGSGLPQGTDIRRVGGKGRPAGKWLTGVGNVGLALCRLEAMTDIRVDAGGEVAEEPGEFMASWEGGEEVGVKAFVPGWHLLGSRTGDGVGAV